MTCCEVLLPGRSYTIVIGSGVLAGSAEQIAHCGRKIAVVSDENVWSLHGKTLEDALSAAGVQIHTVIVPPGESSKSMDMLVSLYGKFYNFGLNRSDCVIAFGGGVVGDLAGFAASTYMRGVHFVQIPTTLLAQVDSGVGGKVAVNLKEGKNLVGSFFQPKLVVSDTSLLSTLPPREWNTGMAEIVKHAAICGGELLELLEVSKPDSSVLERMVHLNCRCKAGFVERDEHDSSVRMMLNFGHTFGHAIETLHHYETYTHGEAVALGMKLALRAGVMLGATAPEVETRLLKLMELQGLEIRLEDRMEDILPLMSGDKKNTGGGITLVLLKQIGEPFTYKTTPEALAALFKGGDSLGAG